MKSGISLMAVDHASSLFLAITFTLCVVFDLLYPQHAMYQIWLKILPGFEWLSWKSFFLGFLESYGYGWYFALIWVPLYNVCAASQPRLRRDCRTSAARLSVHASPAEGPHTAEETALYTCPMHPDTRQKEQGICPKCGMALELIAAPGQK